MASLATQTNPPDGESKETPTNTLPLHKIYAQRWSSEQSAQSSADLVPMASFIAEEKAIAFSVAEEESTKKDAEADAAPISDTEIPTKEAEMQKSPAPTGAEGTPGPLREVQGPLESEQCPKNQKREKDEDEREEAEDEGESTVSDRSPSEADQELPETGLSTREQQTGQREPSCNPSPVEAESLETKPLPIEGELRLPDARPAEVTSSAAEEEGLTRTAAAANIAGSPIEKMDAALCSTPAPSLETKVGSQSVSEQANGSLAAPSLEPSMRSPTPVKAATVPVIRSCVEDFAREELQLARVHAVEVPSGDVENSTTFKSAVEEDNSIGNQETRPKSRASAEFEPRVQPISGEAGPPTSSAVQNSTIDEVLRGARSEEGNAGHKPTSAQTDGISDFNQSQSTVAPVAEASIVLGNTSAVAGHLHTTKPLVAMSDEPDPSCTSAVGADPVPPDSMRVLVEDVGPEPCISAEESVLASPTVPNMNAKESIAKDPLDRPQSATDTAMKEEQVNEQPVTAKLIDQDAIMGAPHSVPNVPEPCPVVGSNSKEFGKIGPIPVFADQAGLKPSSGLDYTLSGDFLEQGDMTERATETSAESRERLGPEYTAERPLAAETLSQSAELRPDVAAPSGYAASPILKAFSSGNIELADLNLIPRPPLDSRSALAEMGPPRKSARSQYSSSPSHSPLPDGSATSRDGLVDNRKAPASGGSQSSSGCENLAKNESANVHFESDMSSGQQPLATLTSPEARPGGVLPHSACDVCNLSFTGPLPYKQHLEGAKHRKALKGLSESTHLRHGADGSSSLSHALPPAGSSHRDASNKPMSPSVLNALGADPRDWSQDPRLHGTDRRPMGPDPRSRVPDPRRRDVDPRLQRPDPRTLEPESRYYDIPSHMLQADPRTHMPDPRLFAGASQQTMPYTVSHGYASSSRILCEICDFHCRSSEELSLHLGSHQHAMRLQYLVSSSMFGAGIAPASFTAPYTYLERETSARGPQDCAGMVRPTESFICDPCDFMSNSMDLYTLHLASNEHALRVAMPSATPAPSADDAEAKAMDTLRCDVCSIFCNTPDVMMIHLKSAKHARKLVVIAQAANAQWKCDLCRSVMSGEASYDAHMKGKQHANMLRRTQGSA
jgi:hypothetical protein